MTDSASHPASPASTQKAPPSRLREFWSSFKENRGAVIGLIVFLGFLFVAILAPLLAPYAPDTQYRDAQLVPPFWQEGDRPASFWAPMRSGAICCRG